MIVMKFGGTSVGDTRAIERVASIVKERLKQKPVVVVSAMAKVTDQLLAMARAAGSGDSRLLFNFPAISANGTTIPPASSWAQHSFTQFHSDLGADLEALDELLRGIAAVGELTLRTTDHVAAYG